MPTQPNSRPSTTEGFIRGLTGADKSLLATLHHGIENMPAVKEMYPYLNFDEYCAFLIGAYKQKYHFANKLSKPKQELKDQYHSLVESQSIYDVMSTLWQKGLYSQNTYFKNAWTFYTHHRHLSEQDKERHRGLNPHKGSTESLQERLQLIPSDIEGRVRDDLTKDYIYFIHENDAEAMTTAFNGQIDSYQIMRFQPESKNANKKTIVNNYIKEINTICKKLPKNVISPVAIQ